ncbi:YceK/YidQ family lipoprotein [Pseudomonas protegens]|uniref:YceK/YidQ family lipoprotein n=1 Tax=Pseudomonas TaxID=286 RepID=UPI003207B8CA
MLLNTLLLNGCGTYMARSGHDWRDDRYYRGTTMNAQILTGYDMGYAGMLTGICWVSVVCPILMVASLPLDAAVDTVLLPYDASKP